MKQILGIVLALAFFSCSGNRQQSGDKTEVYELDKLLSVADQELDKTITVMGYVTHTCKHSGKKCFIVGESQKISLRVEAEGEIETFTPDLVGSKLAITGILKEHQLSQEYIDELENDVKQLENQEGMEAACAAELANISDMRQWMKENDKDYYSLYYMDGLKYEVLD